MAGSDLIWNGPSFLARLCGQTLPLLYRRPPIALPDTTLDMSWHQRFDEDPAHTWFRGVVSDGLQAAMAALGVDMLAD